jgi:hypothetical protein
VDEPGADEARDRHARIARDGLPDRTVFDVETLANPEPRFFILGHKSYGRSPNFLLETGYAQARAVVAKLAADLPTNAVSDAVRA